MNATQEMEIAVKKVPACPMCGDAGELLFDRLQDNLFSAPGEWRLRICKASECGIAWLDPAPLESELWKAYATYYTHKPRDFSGKKSVIRNFYRRIKRGYLGLKYSYSASALERAAGALLYFFPGQRSGVDTEIRRIRRRAGGRLLDVGCGAGEWLMFMRERGWETAGVDFDEAAVKAANDVGLKVALGSVEQQQYPGESFDVITLNHVIEHVPHPLETLRECHRILKKGGILYVATPNISSLGRSIFGDRWRGLEPPRHLQIFSPGALSNTIKKAGFDRAEVRTHPSLYVWNESSRLAENSPHPKAIWRLSPKLLNLMGQTLWIFNGRVGECIDALAFKSKDSSS